MRQNRLRMQQEAQRDAPDPRESRPPCYSEAILLPRLDGSFASLDELNNSRNKNKRHRRKTEEADDYDENVPLRRNRCRSEEVISMRETIRSSVRSPKLVPRTHPLEIEPIDRNRSSNEDEEGGQPNLSTSIRTLEHSPGPSRTRTPKTSIQPNGESYEGLRNFNRSTNTLERSPYAKRKLSHSENLKCEKGAASTSNQETIEIVDDHFENEKQNHSSSESEDSDDFITIKVDRRNSNSSSNEDGLVVLRKPSNI
jgi:hypothetical protein